MSSREPVSFNHPLGLFAGHSDIVQPIIELLSQRAKELSVLDASGSEELNNIALHTSSAKPTIIIGSTERVTFPFLLVLH